MMKGGDPDSLQNGGNSDQQAIQFQPEISEIWPHGCNSQLLASIIKYDK